MNLSGLNFVVALALLSVSVWAVGEAVDKRAAYGLALVLMLGAMMTQHGQSTALANLASFIGQVTGSK